MLQTLDETQRVSHFIKYFLADRHRVTILADINMPTAVIVIDGRRVACVMQEMLLPARNEKEDDFGYAVRMADWISPRVGKYFAIYRLDLTKKSLKYIQHPGFRKLDLYEMITEYRDVNFRLSSDPEKNIDNILRLATIAKDNALDAKTWRGILVEVIRGIAVAGNIDLSKFVKDVDGDLYDRSKAE